MKKGPAVTVFSNLAISLDGKIADRISPREPLGTPLDRATMQVIRRRADAVVFGAGTLRAWPAGVRMKPMKGKRPKQLVNVVVTASGDLDPSWPFWQHDDLIRFVFTTNAGFERALKNAGDRAFVVAAGEDRVDSKAILERLKASNLTQILVEGGGELMASFLEDKCLHELYVTLTPWLLGGRENPTLVGGLGLDPWVKLRLLKMKRVKDEIYFHWKVPGALRV